MTLGLVRPETWRPVRSYEGIYEVSDQGKVRSLDRVVTRSDGSYRKLKGVILSPAKKATGHLCLSLRKGGKQRTVSVHHLVLEAFIGPRPDGMVACHWDDDPTNNHVSNLRWGTTSDNMHDRVRNGRHYQARKTRCESGHEFTTGNTYVKHNGTRACRKCLRRRDKEHYARNPSRRIRRA